MANRTWTQFQGSLEKAVTSVFCTVTGTGASLPTLNGWNGSALTTAGTGGYKGVKSLTRNGQGDITFTFTDNYTRLLDLSANALAIDGSTTPLAVAYWIKAINTTATTGATVRIIFYLATPGTAIDMGTNDRWFFQFVFSNSSSA